MKEFFDDDMDSRSIHVFYDDLERYKKIERLQFKLDLSEAFSFAYVFSRTKGGSVDLEKYQSDLADQINELKGFKPVKKVAAFWKLILAFKKPKKKKGKK